MGRRRKLSRQAFGLLRAMLSNPNEWRYGYDLAKEVGLQSGTLYPLLIRLAEQGLLASEWRPPAREGLPPRHAYRLTIAGIALARSCAEPSTAHTGRPGLASA
jgi:PadR family transcriptional regulator, regulatory protein PadR